MKRRLQARRRFQRKRRAYFGQTATGPYNNKGFSRMGSKKKPKQPTKTQQQITREFLKKAGLHQTKAQRRAQHTALESYIAQRLGVPNFKIQKLSDIVAKPSRYTVKTRHAIYGPEAKPIGEKLVIKKLYKSGQGKGGGGGERGSHVTGSAVARKAAARLGGTRGERPKREKKKKKK